MATSRKNMSDDEWATLAQIGSMFKELRLEAGLNQKEAAKALGTSQARLPVLENGQADVMITTLMRHAALYGYNVEISLVPAEEDEFTKALREAVEELEEERAG